MVDTKEVSLSSVEQSHRTHTVNLKSLEAKQDYATQQRREEEKFLRHDGSQRIFEMPLIFEDAPNHNFNDVSPNWVWAKFTLRELENERSGQNPPNFLRNQLLARIERHLTKGISFSPTTLPPYGEFRGIIAKYKSHAFVENITFNKKLPPPMADQDYLDRLNYIHTHAFGRNSPPNDADEKDGYEFVKRKLYCESLNIRIFT